MFATGYALPSLMMQDRFGGSQRRDEKDYEGRVQGGLTCLPFRQVLRFSTGKAYCVLTGRWAWTPAARPRVRTL